MMKNCPQCKYPNPDSRQECFKCGASLDGRPQPATPVNPEPQAPTAPYVAGQPLPGYQNPNTSYSAPVVLPMEHSRPMNRGLLLGLAVIFVVLMFGGIQAYMSHSLNKAVNKKTNPANYSVVSCTLEANGMGIPMVKGQIYNNTQYNVRMATVTVDLYNAEGKVVGTTVDITTEWSPHENWTFEAMVTEPTAVAAQIKDVRMSLLKQ